MATLDQLVTRAKRLIGRDAPPRNEIRDHIVDAIICVQEEVPNDALKDLLRYHKYTMDGASYITLTANYLRILSLTSEESDGYQGYPWTLVDRDMFKEIMRNELEQSFDSTATRIYTPQALADDVGLVSPATQGFDLYPTPVSDRTMELRYFLKASESGTMSLPTFLHELVINKVAGVYSDKHLARYERGLAGVRLRYTNKYGLSPADVGIIRGL